MPRLLIADDAIDLACVLERAALRANWEVSVSSNGSELLAALKALETPAFVLVDINMPELDGIEFAQLLHEYSDLPRIRLRFMTGGPIVGAVAATLIAKARDFEPGMTLYKPFSMSSFGEVLEAEAAHLA